MEAPRATLEITDATSEAQLMNFLNANKPSVIRPDQCSWIQVTRNNPNSLENFQDIEGAILAWSCATGPKTKLLVEQLAQKHLVLVGKWLLFVSRSNIDATWAQIATAVRNGSLGSSAKVSPIAGAPVATALICVYTENYLDIADVKRVRNTLRQMGFTRKMSYKPDIYTYLDIYQNNPWRIPPTVYTE